MIEALQFPFIQNALFVGLLASIACGVIGTYVVVKRIGFISGSIAHSAFGGIGISYYLGVNPLIGAIAMGIFAAGLITGIKFNFKQREDTLIGAVWAVGMALGVLFIYKTEGYTANLMSYLFGNILLTTSLDIKIIFLLNFLLLGIVALFYRALQALTFDEYFSTVKNLPVKWLYLLLLTLIALCVVILIRLVGIILVIALIALPAASAEQFAKNIKQMMIGACGFGILASTLGILLSFVWDFPTGPMIVLISYGLYMVSLLAGRMKQK